MLLLLLFASYFSRGQSDLLSQNLRGKYEHSLQHIYTEGTCGKPEWTPISSDGSDAPHGSVIAGRDLNLHDSSHREGHVVRNSNEINRGKTQGESLFVCRVLEDNGGEVGAESSDIVPGKTWLHRTDACCNAAIGGDVLRGDAGDSSKKCQMLTMSERAHGGSRLEWIKTTFVGDQRHML